MRKFITQSDLVVPWHYPRVVMETAVFLGCSRHAVLAGTELSERMFESADARMSYEQYDALIDNAIRLTGDPALGLLVGRHIGSAQLGVLGLAIAASTSIGGALDLLLRYTRRIAPAWELSVSIEGAAATLTARESIPRGRHRCFATEVLLAACAHQARALLRRPLPLRGVSFAYPEPAHSARYSEVFQAPLIFGSEVTCVEFDASLLVSPVPFADPAVAEQARRFCEERMPEDAPPDGLVGSVRALLDAAQGPPPSIEQIARTLQTSTRTLSRHFQKMGTSYRTLLEESRRHRAFELSRSANLSDKKMADTLGFDNVRSFRRALRRWLAHEASSAPPR